MEKTSNEKQNNNSNSVSGNQSGLCVEFVCKICEETQTIQPSYYSANEVFPLCDNCIKDLKEFVMSKRGSRDKKSQKAIVIPTFYDKTFRKIPIIISETYAFKGWRAEIADNYEFYKPSKFANINFEDLGFHFSHNIDTHELDNYVFLTRKDAVKCAKEVMQKYKLNCKIWFL